MNERKKITEESRGRILRAVLNKGQDIDRALNWMDKTFEIVSEQDLKEHNLDEARKRGLIE